MQSLMIRLEALVRRRRRVVLAAWAIVLVAAVPLAAHQSDRLTGGGFGVPGSQSKIVSDQLARDFADAERATLAAVVVPGRGADPEHARAAVTRLTAAAHDTPLVAIRRADRARALAAAARHPERPQIVPL